MQRNNMLWTLVAGLLGFLIGLSMMLVIYPFIFSPPVLNEKISNESPVGAALLNGKVGETIEIKAPAGVITYQILGIN